VEDGKVGVGIADEGPGIPQTCQRQIFEPFFTTKPVGVGTGLGSGHRPPHRGRLLRRPDPLYDTRPGKTEFIVRIPVSR
jgi:signal transduction histidine kinase